MAAEDAVTAAFRSKVEFMSKNWMPQSTPSSRDRLELYAWHKQAVSGDAPSTFSTSASAAERSKYQAWKSKKGTSPPDAMRSYLQEADRQVRVYGSKPSSASASTMISNGGTITNGTSSSSNHTNGGGGGGPSHPSNGNSNSNNNNTTTNGNSQSSSTSSSTSTPRGLAAIPLLCAAAAESRPAYVRRLQQTPSLDNGWWQRQEPLCYPPGSFGAIPEAMLLVVAKLVERISLTPTPIIPQPTRNGLISFLWPFHNTLLSLWMGLILYLTSIRCVWNTILILVWGSRRTGIALSQPISNLSLVSKSISSMVEPNQALTVRLVGLLLLPIPTVWNVLLNRISNGAISCTLFDIFVSMTWWYWFLIVPMCSTVLVWTAIGSGFCFAIIEFAGV